MTTPHPLRRLIHEWFGIKLMYMEITDNISAGMKPAVADLLRRHSVASSSPVREALGIINALSGDSMTLFALDSDGRLVGTVTDGDIRRGLLAGIGLSDPVERVMHREFLSAAPGDDICLVMAQGRRMRLSLVPVLKDGRIIDVVDLHRRKTLLPVDAVLMAGGKGERLRPLTEHTPKPLLPVGGKPIIDYNIEELEACGVERIFVTVNYLASQIERHFAGREGDAEVKCVREPKRLGTMGSLALVEGLRSDNVLLMNSDLLTSIDFEALYLHHRDSGADLTMAAVPYTVSVPFAIMHLDGNRVTGLEEKPTYNYFANGGVYIMRRDLLRRIVPGEYLDAPDFITTLIADGGKVGCCPTEGTWIDIGSPDDYRYANELMGRRTLRR